MLPLAEQILVLLLDEQRGEFLPVSKFALARVLIGAILMDLAFASRIDTDTASLMIIDRTPTGNPLFDSVLERVGASETTKSAYAWIEILSEEEADKIRERALAGMVERGILEIREARKLWVFKSRRYFTTEHTIDRDTKLRIMNVLYSDQIPDPRDIALVCLADACGILSAVFEAREIERIMPRIDLINKMDLIGREMIGQLAVWKLGYKRPADT